MPRRDKQYTIAELEELDRKWAEAERREAEVREGAAAVGFTYEQLEFLLANFTLERRDYRSLPF